MSEHNDNTNHKPLKDLLNKSKGPDEQPMDDFEKEALEGFAMLEQDEEKLLELKDQLDTRIYAEVFVEEEKRNRGAYWWYAAAGLFLVIGFSVYFIQSSGVSKPDNLAIQSKKEAPKDELRRNLNIITEKEKTVEPRFEPAQTQNQNLTVHKNIRESRETKDKPANKETPDLEEEKAAETALDLATNQVTIVPGNAAAPSTQNFGFSSNTNPPAYSSYSPPQGAAYTPTLNPQPLANTKTDEDKKEVIVLQKNQAGFSQQDMIVQTEAATPKKRKYEEGRAKKQAPAVASGAGPSIKSTSYSGGDEALNKELKKRLGQKGLLQKFDAVLYINEKGEVEKVVLSDSAELNESQQKDLIHLLKKLDKFNVTGLSKNDLAEYKLNFRP